jgi:hypothetical protein
MTQIDAQGRVPQRVPDRNNGRETPAKVYVRLTK